MIPVLGVPTMNQPVLLRRMIESIDHPIDTLVIVQNGPDECLGGTIPPESISVLAKVRPNKTTIIRHPNAGVGGSWNEVLMLWPRAPWWMFVNDDIAFLPGSLAKMEQAIVDRPECAVVQSSRGYAWFCMAKRAVRNIGLFDPNLYPAYNEDNDYFWRLKCVGELWFEVTALTLHGMTDDPHACKLGSNTIRSNPAFRAENSRTHGANNEYYRRKWGGPVNGELWAHPFNNPHWPVSYCPYNPDIREANQWNT